MKPFHRRSLVLRKRSAPGASPGTLVQDPAAEHTEVRVMHYDADGLQELKAQDSLAVLDDLPASGVTWVDVYGLGDLELIRELGERFDIHGLALEDVVNVHQRPKVEEYDDHLFLVARMFLPDVDRPSEQIAMFIGANYVVTFQERLGDCLDQVRARLRGGRGRLRISGSDYLGYAILDAVIDGCFPVLEQLGETIEDLEVRVTSETGAGFIREIHAVKRELIAMRRAVWPLRELVNSMIRDEPALISKTTRLFLRDCYDHSVQLMDMLETYRDVAGSLVDIHLSSLSIRMNEIMKVLTIIATIFIPLGFIAGLYGMNFDRSVSPWNMPELAWRFGYPGALALMLAVAGGLLWYFKRKGWLGGDS